MRGSAEPDSVLTSAIDTPRPGVLARAIRVLRTEGLRGVLGRVRDRAEFRRNRYVIYALVRESGEGIVAPKFASMMERFGIQYTLSWLALDAGAELDEYVAYRRQPEMTREEVDKRLRAGRRCCIARLDGELVGDSWMAMNEYPTPVSNRTMDARLSEAGFGYGYLTYVAPRARGRGLYPILIREMMLAARASGGRGLFGCTLRRSRASVKTLEHLGFEKIGRLFVYVFLGRSFSLVRFDSAPEAL